MEQIVSEKAKGISRFLAVLSGLAGLWLAYHSLPMFGPDYFSNILGSIFLLNFAGLMIAAWVFLLWLSVQLWTKDDIKYLRRWAVIPAVVVCLLIEWSLSELCKFILGYYYPNADVIAPLSGFSSFVGLLAAGIVYVRAKRLLYRVLDRTELVDPITFRGHRRHYFAWLAFCLWGMLWSVYELLDELGYVSMTEDTGIGFLFLPLSLLAVVIFYKLCVHFFVTRPLKRLLPEMETIRADSR